MLAAILVGLLRHMLTAAGTALVAHAVTLVEGSPVVHDLTTAVCGSALVIGSGLLSTLSKVKTQSGPIYKVNK